MMNIGRILATCLIMGLFFMACNSSKSEEKSETKNPEIVNKAEEKNKEDTIDHGYEIAMASYQCPMKCEGDKFYKEEGTCPKCKMDLKKVEEESKGTEEGHQHKE